MNLEEILLIMRRSGATSVRYRTAEGAQVDATFAVEAPEGPSEYSATTTALPARPQFRTGSL